MAWVTKENIDSKKPLIKALCKEYGVKASLSGTNDYSMTLTIASAAIDFIASYCELVKENPYRESYDKEFTIEHANKHKYLQVNEHYLDSYFSGKALEFLQKAKEIMNQGNHDNSDIQTDYFDVGWYINIHIGRWNKPFEFKN